MHAGKTMPCFSISLLKQTSCFTASISQHGASCHSLHATSSSVLHQPCCIPQWEKSVCNLHLAHRVQWLSDSSCKQECFEPDMLSPACVPVCDVVTSVRLWWWWQLKLAPRCPSLLHLQELYASVQSNQVISMALGSVSHQRRCQRGLFRRGPMTDCDVAGVFGQNGAIQTLAGGWERVSEERVRKRERRGETRQRGERQGETGRGGGGTGKALTDSNGASWQSRNIVWNQSVIVELLSLSLWCGTRPFTETICSVLSQSTLLLGYTKVMALYPSLSASLSVSLFVKQLSTQSYTVLSSGDQHRNSRLMARAEVLMEGLLLQHRVPYFLQSNDCTVKTERKAKLYLCW